MSKIKQTKIPVEIINNIDGVVTTDVVEDNKKNDI